MVEAAYVGNRGAWWQANSLVDYNAVSPQLLAAHNLSLNNGSDLSLLATPLSAVLGTVAVWLTWAAGTRLWGRTVGLLAGAILGLAFLPVFYSHLALNDVPTL